MPGSRSNPAISISRFFLPPRFNTCVGMSTAYGDIVPVDPFARSLANLESVVGPLFLAITVARLVSMELADRRR